MLNSQKKIKIYTARNRRFSFKLHYMYKLHVSGICVYSVSSFVIFFLVFSISPVCALLVSHLSTSFFFSDCNWYFILNFSIHMFIASVYRYNWLFLCVLTFFPANLLNSLTLQGFLFLFLFCKSLRIFYLIYHVIWIIDMVFFLYDVYAFNFLHLPDSIS